ncbi:MAG: AAA family ATPase [Polyangiales bacterium]
MTEPNVQAQVETFERLVARVREEVSKRIVGQREVVDGVLTVLLGGGHGLLEGVPGLGKTLLVRTLADALELSFARIQFTPDLMPADVLGTTVIAEGVGAPKLEFQRGPVFAHVVLADEVNRATPKTQSALLEAMQEASVTVSGTTHALEEPFMVLATQNPLEMEGTYPLPEAQLDRFMLKLEVPFPSHEELHAILERTTGPELAAPSAVVTRAELVAMRGLVRSVPVTAHVRDYAVRILEATHPGSATAPASVKQYVRFGASPRGAQAMLTAAKVRTLFGGRFSAGIDDVRDAVKPALRHRLILNFEGEADGVRPDALLDDVLAATREVR